MYTYTHQEIAWKLHVTLNQNVENEECTNDEQQKEKKKGKIENERNNPMVLTCMCMRNVDNWYTCLNLTPSAVERNASTNIIIEIETYIYIHE